MCGIWWHRASGERFLVAYHFGAVNAAAGPLHAWEDPGRVLETHSNQEHNVAALLPMRAAPEEYIREYGLDQAGRAVVLPAR